MQEWDETTGSWDAANTISNIKELFWFKFSVKKNFTFNWQSSKLIELIDSQFTNQHGQKQRQVS